MDTDYTDPYIASSLIRVQSVCFHDKFYKSAVDLSICS